MTIHRYSERQVEQTLRMMRRVRLWYCVVAAGALVAVSAGILFPADWLRRVNHWVATLIFVIFAVPLSHMLLNWKSARVEMEKSLRDTSVQISPSDVSVSYGFDITRRVEREDILRAEEPATGAGLYVRTSNRYRWVLIPRKIDGYENIKRELEGLGIPLVRTSIPSNWEEYVFVLFFTGTIICASSAHSPRVLLGNLLVSAVVSFGGFWIIKSNPDNIPRARWSKFGAFLPVCFATLGLWFALRP